MRVRIHETMKTSGPQAAHTTCRSPNTLHMKSRCMVILGVAPMVHYMADETAHDTADETAHHMAHPVMLAVAAARSRQTKNRWIASVKITPAGKGIGSRNGANDANSSVNWSVNLNSSNSSRQTDANSSNLSRQKDDMNSNSNHSPPICGRQCKLNVCHVNL